jgi:hypothetical protein
MTEVFLIAHEISQKNTGGFVSRLRASPEHHMRNQRTLGLADFFLHVSAYAPAFLRIYVKMLRLFVTTDVFTGIEGL